MRTAARATAPPQEIRFCREEIAEALTLSVRTVERHLSNIYTKLDLHGKSARTGAVARLLTSASA